ncbi:hypothetical protein GCM10010420_01860 [Streptomyces glaucosporus]|uniref:Uncharacterized protein n=1 Tax=Streptomyces glaucosporus TaxID=284044 RepID=A0ABN3HLL7_9ACTN
MAAVRRAGQSIAVPQRYCAKVLDGQEERMNELIDRGFAEHAQALARTWPTRAGRRRDTGGPG